MKDAAASVKVKKLSSRNDELFGFALTLPAIIVSIFLFLFPLLYSFGISLTDYNYVKGTMNFVGLRNYLSAFSDREFLSSLRVTLAISFGAMLVQFLFGVTLAVLVNHVRLQGFFKTVFLMPMMIAPTVSGMLFRFMLNNEFGVVNAALKELGAITGNIPWLTDARLAFYCVILVDSWTCIPFVFLLIYTALSGLPTDMLEAGRIDGGNAWQIFFRIQLPNIRGALMVTMIMRFMDVFRIYDSIYIMTNGGPGSATEALSLYIYRINWNKYQMGKASSLSYIMMVIMAIFGILMQYFSVDKADRELNSERKAEQRKRRLAGR